MSVGLIQALASKYREYLKPFEGHTQQVLDSRIVDHNLDVVDPPNGWYVRYDSTVQMAFGEIVLFVGAEGADPISGSQPFPAQFASTNVVLFALNERPTWRVHSVTSNQTGGLGSPMSWDWQAERVSGSWNNEVTYGTAFLAVGLWKEGS